MQPAMPSRYLENEAMCEQDPGAFCPVGQGSFQIDCFVVEKSSIVR